MSKALETHVYITCTFRKERCTMALHPHRKAGWVSKFTFYVSLLLCSGSQPAALSFFSPDGKLAQTSLFFMPFTSLLFSKVKIKPTPTLRVGGRTSRQWHITFLSFYRPNFHACKTIHFQAVREPCIMLSGLGWWWCHAGVNSGVYFLISMLDLLYLCQRLWRKDSG